MTNAIVKIEYTAEQIDLIKRQICPNSTDDELAMFISQCKRSGLDPFARQIYSIERREKKKVQTEYGGFVDTWETKRSVQISIDGARLVAERTGEYEGQTPPQWCDSQGNWVDIWLSDTEYPVAAKVGVYRKGFREPLIGIAKFKESAPLIKGNLSPFWTRMPAHMIAKVAEAQALRKAFPQELSGFYTKEEQEKENYDLEAEYQESKQKWEKAAGVELPAALQQAEPLVPDREQEAQADLENMTHDMLISECLHLMDSLNYPDERRVKAIQYYGGANAEILEVLTDEQLKKMRTQLKRERTKVEKKEG